MDSFDDAFGDNSSTAPVSVEKSSNGNGLLEDEPDPAAEFLAREQSNFAGLEDEIPVVAEGTGGGVTTNGNSDDGFEFSNGNGTVIAGGGADDFEQLGGGGSNGLLDDEFSSTVAPNSDTPPTMNGSGPQYNVFLPREEPEKIKIWREEQQRRLEVKDAEEEESKEKLREAAKKELDDWYKNYEEQISKTKNSNRAAEQDGASSASGDASPSADGKDWERIANLCDFNPKSSKQQKDISRMRSLILQLKQNPPISRRQSSAGSSNAS